MLYDEKEMLELCEQLGIEVVDGCGHSLLNGEEIEPDKIDGLFDFSVYVTDKCNEVTTFTNYNQTFFNFNDVSNIEVSKPQTKMSKTAYFQNIPNVGDLYLLCTLFTFNNIDIVFICKDDNDNLYLCLCTDAMFNYCCMVRRIDVDKILEVLENKISIYQAFKDSNDYITVINYKDNKFSYYEKLFDNFEKNELPCEDEYLDLDDNIKQDIINILTPYNICMINEESPLMMYNSTSYNLNYSANYKSYQQIGKLQVECEFFNYSKINSINLENSQDNIEIDDAA